MKPDRLTLIAREVKRHSKAKNAEAVVYYRQVAHYVASVNWETFRGSWAYSFWKDKHADAIKDQKQEFNRFHF